MNRSETLDFTILENSRNSNNKTTFICPKHCAKPWVQNMGIDDLVKAKLYAFLSSYKLIFSKDKRWNTTE